jgi:competence protein ComFC
MSFPKFLYALIELKDDLLDFVYPQHCAICKKHLNRGEKYVCEVCWNSLVILPDPFCPYCRSFYEPGETKCSICQSAGRIIEDHKISMVRSLGRFDEYYKELIHRFKYDKKIPLGMRLGQRLGETLNGDSNLKTQNSCFSECHLLIPVPLHKSRYRERGFNQSEIIAEEISKITDVPVLKNALKRKKNTKDQTNLSPQQREENVSGAFAVTQPEMVNGKRIILVDDVITTGATLNECARMLKQAGAEKILAMTIAVVTD